MEGKRKKEVKDDNESWFLVCSSSSLKETKAIYPSVRRVEMSIRVK